MTLGRPVAERGGRRHIFRCPMRWSDMDAFQHVNNTVFLTYLEEARVDLLITAGAEAGRSALDEGIVVARHSIDYLAPLVFHSDGVLIDVWVTGIGGSSFDLAYEVHDETRVFARASSTMVLYDMTAARPRRISPEERAWLASFLPTPVT